MHPVITAAVANQRHAELIAQAEAVGHAYRPVRESHAHGGSHGHLRGVVRLPLSMWNWIAAGQL